MNNFNITLGQYVKGNSYLHKLDPRLKIVSTLILMVSIFLIPADNLNNLYVLLGFLGLFLIILLTSKISLIAVLKGLQPIIFIGVFTFVLQLIYNQSGTVIQDVVFNFSWASILIAIGVIILWYLTKKFIPFKLLYTIIMLVGVLLVFALVNTNFDFANLNLVIYSDGLLKLSRGDIEFINEMKGVKR